MPPHFSHPSDSSVMQIGQVSLRLSRPLSLQQVWMGDQEILRQLLACWFVVDEKDVPLSPRIVGQPGVGKTTLAMAATQERKQDLFIYQCTADTRPEDLLVSPVIAEGGTITYQASPLVTAMLTGNVCLLDEGNRMNEKSWASLASLLDHRRSVESIVAGVQIRAHENFRCCVTMNEDASTYEVPDYILSRLQPTLKVEFPAKEHELAILRYHLPFAPTEMVNLTVNFLQKAHQLDLPFSVRDGIHMVQYAMKRMAQDPNHPVARDVAWREALIKVLGEEALDLDLLAKRRSQALSGQALPRGLGDFFFDEDHPLHPDH
ncbi:MAG: AAA family ATPase [Nitrospirota bacterium]|nr:AAA family ATPase [Nitrospirota bacterium]MDH4360124.1 AAA family ATPase [Nitrospirota bacterium]